MSLVIKRGPMFSDLSNLLEEVFMPHSTPFSGGMLKSPAVNVIEKENAFFIELAAPGLGKSDFKIEMQENQLSISAEKKSENQVEEGGKFTRKEFSFSSFKRTFTIPENKVLTDSIKAVYDNGILKVEIPKRMQEEPFKKLIEIA